MLKKILIYTFFTITTILAILGLLFKLGILWKSPSYYNTESPKDYSDKIYGMDYHDSVIVKINPPYYYQADLNKGKVLIMGITHTVDPSDSQLTVLEKEWDKFKPTALLVEGRMGFLFKWFQDPVTKYGEGGKSKSLAHRDGVSFYTWEPDRETEIREMVSKFGAEKTALFYSLRPYFSSMRFGKPASPDAVMEENIRSRTDYNQLRGKISSIAQVDSIWKKDFPNEKDWRDYSDEYGWPEGYFTGMALYSNIIRDVHMLNIIDELTEKGERVFVTMGMSHAVRIQKAFGR
ncbi:MAG: hypothetical protein HUU43_16055 [Ignavibacteriaceae bacterium]|nr:hypothetical protein [Ignavibacteriaceae bacterium]